MAGTAVSRLRSTVRPCAALVCVLFRGAAMRATKLAIRDALRTDDAISNLVPPGQIHATERATIPALTAVELVGVSSELVGDGPMAKHSMSCEVTVSATSEDGADETLDTIVQAVRARLNAAAYGGRPVGRADGGNVLVSLGGTRWSISASVKAGVVRGASVALSVEGSD